MSEPPTRRQASGGVKSHDGLLSASQVGPMTWQYDAHTGTWEMLSGSWRAIVTRLSDAGDWYPYVQHIDAAQERYDGPHCTWAADARLWYQAENKALERGSRALKTTPRRRV